MSDLKYKTLEELREAREHCHQRIQQHQQCANGQQERLRHIQNYIETFLPAQCRKDLEVNADHICARCIKKGTVLYFVHGLGSRSFTQEIECSGEPFDITGLTEFVPYGTDGKQSFSLRDAGVIVNTYNQHKMFRVNHNAENYLKLCKEREYDRR